MISHRNLSSRSRFHSDEGYYIVRSLINYTSNEYQITRICCRLAVDTTDFSKVSRHFNMLLTNPMVAFCSRLAGESSSKSTNKSPANPFDVA
jgi:hypothetical protein